MPLAIPAQAGLENAASPFARGVAGALCVNSSKPSACGFSGPSHGVRAAESPQRRAPSKTALSSLHESRPLPSCCSQLLE